MSLAIASSRLRFTLFACVLTLLAPPMVWAQTPSSKDARAEKLFQEGKTLLDQGNVDQACVQLTQSLRLERAVGTLGLLAHCHERQGRSASAYREYLQAAELAQQLGEKDREKAAREFAQSLESKLYRLQIDVPQSTPGLVLYRNGVPIAASEWNQQVPVDPGPVEVLARAKGFFSWRQRVTLSGEATLAIITVPPLKKNDSAFGESDDSSLTAAPAAPDPKKPPLWTQPGFMLATAGVLGLGFGSYMGLRAISKNNESKDYCDSNVCSSQGGALRDDAKSAATLSTIGIGAGAACLGAGLWLLLHPHRPAPPSTTVGLATDGSRGSTGLIVSGHF